MTFQSKSKLTFITRLVPALLLLAAACGIAAGQTNTFPNTGNAGIGTTSPGDALQIVKDNGGLTLDTATSGSIVPVFRFSTTGTGRASIQYRPDLPGLAFQTGGIAYPAQNRMVLTDSGNFGIGTMNPAVKLHSQLSSSNTGTPTGSDMGMFINNSDTTANNYALIGFGNAFPQFQAAIGSINLASGPNTGGHLVFHTRPAAGSTAERMRIDSSGRVGIGTTAPAALLDLKGSNPPYAGQLRIAANDYAQITFYDGVNLTPNGTNRKSWLYHDMFAGTFNLASQGNILLYPTNYLGINQPSPAHKLDVGGMINSNQGLCIAGDCKTAWSQVGGGSQWTTAGTSVYYTTGGVGIGTQSPGYQLDVQSNAQWAARFRKTDATHGGILIDSAAGFNPNVALSVNGTVKWFMNSNVAQSDSLQFWESTGAYPRFTLTQAGNVGIGTTAPPAEKLEVNGNLKLSGTGNINASGTIEANNIKAKYQDLAEWVPSSEQLSAGTVVVLDTAKSNQVISSTVSYDTRVAGVISAQPGITLGEGGEGKVLVATTGRVRVKVDASRGAIQIGDLIVTSDVPGVAMKSEAVEFAGRKMHMPGTIIGKALEPLAKGSGEILVLLSLQ